MLSMEKFQESRLDTFVNMNAMMSFEAIGKNGRQRGECVVRAGSDARNCSIGKADENRIDRIDLLPNLSSYAPTLVQFVLMKATSIRQPRRV